MASNLLAKLKRLEQSVKQPMTSNCDDECRIGPLPHFEPTPLHETDDLHQQFVNAGFEMVETPFGTCWRRKTSFDLLTRHGNMSFYDAVRTSFSYYEKLVQTPVHIGQLRFYDVETNGLGTGAGTFPFLHTIGCFEDDELVFVQYILDDYDAEAAVLWALGEFHLPDDAIVVTYNGKSFDWPLLQSRRVMHQMTRLQQAQLDLLHLSRRLWKKQLSNLKLTSLEHFVLGVERTDDLPGSEAPERYMRYLEERDVALLEPVLSHNLMDVCSLVTLQVEIARHLNGEMQTLTADMHLALARWYDVWHDVQAAEASYRRAYQGDAADWHEHWLYSLFLKRQHHFDAAQALWLQMVEKYPEAMEPLIELAKHYEHRQRNFAAAEEAVLEALVRQKRYASAAGRYDDLRYALQHRLTRIRMKRSKAETDIGFA